MALLPMFYHLADERRIRDELGITCSTTELPRHMEPGAGFEPATTRFVGDNPILRPVESSSLPFGIFVWIVFAVFIFAVCP